MPRHDITMNVKCVLVYDVGGLMGYGYRYECGYGYRYRCRCRCEYESMT